MSIAVAVRKNKQVVLATDSQTTFGATCVGFDNLAATKIRKVGNSYLATTGWGLYEDMLRDFLESRKSQPSLRTTKSIYTFFLRFWKRLHDKYSYVNDQPNEKDSPFGDLDSSFMIINSAGIFHIASDMSVTQFQQYFAIGSGCDFSLGAIHALYDSSLDARVLAERAVKTAMQFNVYCGGPLQVVTVKTR